MSSHILVINTDDECWFSYRNPVKSEICEKQTKVIAEFNGTAHAKKLRLFLDTIEVTARPGKEERAEALRKYIRQLKRKAGDFQIGGNLTVKYKELQVDFSV